MFTPQFVEISQLPQSSKSEKRIDTGLKLPPSVARVMIHILSEIIPPSNEDEPSASPSTHCFLPIRLHNY